MQAGFSASARRRGGRHLLFTMIVAALLGVNAWLWGRLAIDASSENSPGSLETGLAALASLAALGMAIAVWRAPISANVRTMTTPALRQTLATHHAGHAVAAYQEDPMRVLRIDLSEPCNLHNSKVPAVTQTALQTEVGVALAGIAAEEIFAGESGSHAANDLAYATDICIDMVGRYGMAGSLVSLGARQRRRRFNNRVLDDARTRKELEALMRDIKRDTVRSMLEQRRVVIALRDALMQNTRIDGTKARAIIADVGQQRHTSDQVLVDLHAVGSRPLIRATEM